LYSNENFPLSAVEALRRFGHDAPTTAIRVRIVRGGSYAVRR
jgi:hypothetical protein